MSLKRKMASAVDNLKHGLWVMILMMLAGIITVVLVVIMTIPAAISGSLLAIVMAWLVSIFVGIMVLGWTFTRFYKR